MTALKRNFARVALVFLALTVPAFAQDTLNNDSVLKMVKAGLGDDLIVTMIQGQPGKYSVTPDDLVKLKQAGASDKILAAMIAKRSEPAPAPTGESAPPASAASAPAGVNVDLPQNPDIGIYYRKSTGWQEMLPEVVNWRTGGVLKHVGTLGVVKGDVNGQVDGVHSRNSLTSPIEILVCLPEGVAITEYQLINLHEEKDSREFRTVTGGVFHESGGSTRDVIPFEGTRVAKGMYRVVLPKLGAGEYGFLPPGSNNSGNNSSARKMYTFRLIE